jgi:hypothetical protein
MSALSIHEIIIKFDSSCYSVYLGISKIKIWFLKPRYFVFLPKFELNL